MKQAIRFVWFLLIIGTGVLYPQSGATVYAGSLLVYEVDNGTAASAPDAAVSINGGAPLFFGTNTSTTIYNLEAGIYTVKVTVAEGYLPMASEEDPNAVNDPTSVYGNPGLVEVHSNLSIISFSFDPIVTVTGIVRNAWTMERLENIPIEFVVNSGGGQGFVCRKYPWTATYASNWITGSSGNFPTNIFLFATDSFDLQINATGYQSFYSNNAITNAAAGDIADFGTILLTPIDNNTNQIADAWETLYFGGSISAEADADGDGMCNRDEYISGTDPTNQYSFLCLDEMSLGSNDTLELSWETQSWHTYRITGCTDLCTGEWVQVAGTWEATNGQTQMSWTETNLDLSWNSNYRVEVVPYDWQGTNCVLINTNRWIYEGGGSGTYTNLPPLP